MRLDDFLTNYQLKFSLIKHEDDCLIAITELIERSTNEIITNIMSKIDVQEHTATINNNQSVEKLHDWDFNIMEERMKLNQLEFLLARIPLEENQNPKFKEKVRENCYIN